MVIIFEIFETLFYIVGIVCCGLLTMTMFDYINYCKSFKERDN